MSPDRSARNRIEPVATVSVTPLCDVSLVLLIVLMVISPLIVSASLIEFSHSSGDSTPVQADTEEDAVKPPVYVRITRDSIYLESKKVNLSELMAELRNLAGENRRRIIVSADSLVPLGTVVNALDACRKSGHYDLYLQRSSPL